VLTAAFIDQWKIVAARRKNDPEMFRQETHFQKNLAKQFVITAFGNLAKYASFLVVVHLLIDSTLPWNHDQEAFQQTPIVVAAHGTDLFVAEKIAQTGFASLSSVVC
jgi:hypothetical protein